MTRCEFIKLLCISCGYQNNIKIETYKDFAGCTLYDVTAYDDNDDYIESQCSDLLDTIHNLIENIHNNSLEEGTDIIDFDLRQKYHINAAPWYLRNWPQKMIFDDEKREQARVKELKRLEYIEKTSALEEKVYKSLPENPCIKCQLKEPIKSLYTGEIIDDAVNYNCNKHFLNNCELSKSWYNLRHQKLKEVRNSKEYQDLKKEYEEYNR